MCVCRQLISFFYRSVRKTAPAGQKQGIDFGGVKHSVDPHTFIFGVNVFGHWTETGGLLPPSEMNEGSQVRGRRRYENLGIRSTEIPVATAKGLESRQIAAHMMAFGAKTVEIDTRWMCRQPSVCGGGSGNRFSDFFLNLGKCDGGCEADSTMKFGKGRHRRGPVAAFDDAYVEVGRMRHGGEGRVHPAV